MHELVQASSPSGHSAVREPAEGYDALARLWPCGLAGNRKWRLLA
jgi:hypothetical protein